MLVKDKYEIPVIKTFDEQSDSENETQKTLNDEISNDSDGMF